MRQGSRLCFGGLRGAPSGGLSAAFWDGLRKLYPGYFAMVMATGIISIDAFLLGWQNLSTWLMWVGQGVWGLLSGLLVLREVCFPRAVRADLLNPGVNFTFFTFVAAAGVLGMRASLDGALITGVFFWWTALVAWLLLIYFIIGTLILHNTEALARIVNGGWLVAAVATQSVAMLTVTLADHLVIAPETARAFGFLSWSVGAVWYGLILGFITSRLAFSPVAPGDLSPPYWINMGAAAISTVAGAILWDAAQTSEILLPAASFIYAATLGLWSWGTWWIPLLLVFGVWKHWIKRHPLCYDPALWSIVFPLGMYTAALLRMSHLTGTPAFASAARYVVWFALVAWLLTTIGLLRSLTRSAVNAFKGPQRRDTPVGQDHSV